MATRGPKPKEIVPLVWNGELAYVVGLIATDGSLSKNGRVIDFTSKDIEQIKNFARVLKIQHLTIGKKSSGSKKEKKYYRIQFSNIHFYSWLVSLGLTQNKSKTLGLLKIPQQLFFDFLRGVFDGDGSFSSYYDPRWRSSFMFYITFTSSSPAFIFWIQSELKRRLDIYGHISKAKGKSYENLRFAKKESLKIIKKMYYSSVVVCLRRKRRKIERALKIDNLTNSARVL